MTHSQANSSTLHKSLILASQSPRRKELLTQLGFQFSVQASDIDETVVKAEHAYDYVLRLAEQKAQHVFLSLSVSAQEHTFVLGSDTSVVCNDIILGKPENEQHCIEMLSLLSKRSHQVYTAIALVSKTGIQRKVIKTDVVFKSLTTAEIKAYWLTGEPQDKAGSYGIQGIAGQFVKSINGSYSAIVGLPLFETAQLLIKAGFAGALNTPSLSK